MIGWLAKEGISREMIFEVSPGEENESTFRSSDKGMERVDGWVVLLGKNDKESPGFWE